MRRRTFSKRANAAQAWAGATPTCSAAAMAASALSWLCVPDSAQCTRRRHARPQHLEVASLARALKSLTALPKPRRSLQQPCASTRAGFLPGR
jgi:hypothetical protein